MSFLLNSGKKFLLHGVCSFLPFMALAQSGYGPQGGEYPVAGLLIGDQVRPSISLQANGGYLVWHDNATDGDGFGISARRVDSNGLGSLGVFRVNVNGAGDQQNVRVRTTKSGGAVFVWQGGSQGNQEIYARFAGPNGVFTTGDVLVNTEISGQQGDPAVALLADGSVAVTWSSFGQDGSLQGVFGQVLSSTGQKVGAEFRVNQFTRANQRTSVVVGLTDGNYVVAWVSEQQRYENSVDIYARLFSPTKGALGNEMLVNTSANVCANPELSASSSGGFLAGWSERDLGVDDNSWDVLVRAFDSAGNKIGAENKVNTHRGGSHFAPQIASNGLNQLVVWTSMGQDGSAEGVFGRFINASGEGESNEFQVNTFSQSKQMHPVIASDGGDQFIAVWTSFIGGATSFDLFAQRYGRNALKPLPPFVSALSSTKLSITWPAAGPVILSGYEVHVDGSVQPIEASQNVATVSALAPGSTHAVRIAYRFVDGSKSALSDAAAGTTWGSDENLDGLPDDWQTTYWGSDSSKWPDPKADSDGDGASNLQEFLAGTNPIESTSVLKMQIDSTAQGNFLKWNTQAAFVYQVQSSGDLIGNWVDVGVPRFAAGETDSLLLEGSTASTYYRVKRLR
ncbi:MAG: hypothetical protein EXS30_06400 [Pedosphaera sp.]|nr:hypothetical protein [Pedosphaera sp.]